MKRVIDYINENKKKKTIIQLLTPIFKHITGERPDGTFDVRYANDAEMLWNKLYNSSLENVDIKRELESNNIKNYKDLIHFLNNHHSELEKEITNKLYKEKNKTWWQTFNDRFKDKKSKEKQNKKEETNNEETKKHNVNTTKKVKEQPLTNQTNYTKATTEDIVLYLSGSPKQFKTTKYYTISFKNEEERNEKINALKHEWKEKTGENISDCNVINKENYITKYKTVK